MLFFLLGGLGKVHAFYQFSLGAFVTVFCRGLDAAPGGARDRSRHNGGGGGGGDAAHDGSARRVSGDVALRMLQRRATGERKDFGEVMAMARRTSSHTGGPIAAEQQQQHGHSRRPTNMARGSTAAGGAQGGAGADDDGDGAAMTPERLEARLASLLHTCTHTVYAFTRRGLFDRDKLTVLTLLTFSIGERSFARRLPAGCLLPAAFNPDFNPSSACPTQAIPSPLLLISPWAQTPNLSSHHQHQQNINTTPTPTQTNNNTTGLRSGAIDPLEYDALCRGAKSASPPPITDELSRWMGEAQWAAVDGLAGSGVPGLAALGKDLERCSDEWAAWCRAPAPERAPMPGDWGRAGEFRRLLLLRALRPDRVPSALQAYCEAAMGPAFAARAAEAFDPAVVLRESSASTPIFFVLFPGYSPSKEIEAFARAKGRGGPDGAGGGLTLISMGQGQEKPAEAALERCIKGGGWVFLDNVHLMQGWLPALERRLEEAAEGAHPDFRCFFSAEPIAGAPQAKIIPEAILQGAIKVANEPPSDMASNMRRALGAFGPEAEARLAASPAKAAAFRAVLFGLCFYHSLLLGRKKFGVGIGAGSGSGLGFCRAYSFNAGDLAACGDVLANYLLAYDAVPWDDLRYMFGEVFYGGHITDGMDRRCCNAYLRVLVRPEILPGGDLADPATWSPPQLELAPGFRAPLPTSLDALRAYAEAALPPEGPAVYGMHPNAELALLAGLGEELFRAVADVAGSGAAARGGGGAAAAGGGASSAAAAAVPAAAGAGGGGEQAVRAALKGYAERLPEPFALLDIEARAKEKTPYVVVALQEAARMNALLAEMRRGLEELQLGLDGALNMSEAMEALARGIATNSVPAAWMAAMSARIQEVLPLTAWYADVLRRHEQLAAWTAGAVAPPASVWLPGLFNPKAFLTAVMQTHARAHKLPLDVMRFVTDVTAKASPDQVGEPAPEGCYVHGLVLEGAGWDREEGRLRDALPGELRTALPVVLVRPVTADAFSLEGRYECPVYVNMQRANVYSPGVATFTLRTADPPHKWVLASAALLLQDETRA